MDIARVAIDAIKGRKYEKYSTAETSESLREALVELNGGSTKVNLKTFRPGHPLFELVQTLIPVIIDEALVNDETLMSLVEYVNINHGDENEFVVHGENDVIVADAAAGIQGVRRQRMAEGDTVVVKTSPKVVRIYEGLNRLLSGRVDFDEFVNQVAVAYKKHIAEDAYKCLDNITASTDGLSAEYVISGAFDEDELLAVINHVEAASGQKAKICGVKSALKKIATADPANEAKSDLYNFGFYGKFYGTPMISMRQSHKPGTDTFALSETKVFVIAGDDKPIKVVNEGDGIMYDHDPSETADLTQEYVYIQSAGTALVLASKIGVADINA